MRYLFHSLCFLALIMLSSVMTFAQKQITENYLVTGPATDYVARMNYSYTVSDDGERIKNGPITISGSQNEQYRNVTLTGKYQLTASAKNDMLNGPMSVNAKYHAVQQLVRGQNVEDYSYTFSGSFLNGLPNGAFVAKATNFGSSSVSYKKGILVGAYHVQEAIDDRILDIKGTFNDSGKMIGQWRIEILGDVSVWEFVNGIRIRESSKSSESTPKQIEMAKRYAAKSISVEELEKNGYVPVQDSIQLGDYASDIFFLNYIANWEKLAGYSFEKSLWVKYTYLYNILPIPETRFEEILSGYRQDGKSPYPSVEYNQMVKAYTIRYPVDNVVHLRRFTDEQLNKVKEAIDYYCRKNPVGIPDLFYKLDLGYSLQEKARNIRNRYDNLKDEDALRRSYSTIGLEINNENKLNRAKKKNYELLASEIDVVGKTLREELNGREMTPDSLFYVFPDGISSTYFALATLTELEAMEKEVKDYGVALDQIIEEERIASEKRQEEERRLKEESDEKRREERKNEAIKLFLRGLSGIENQPANAISGQLNSLIVKMGSAYYDRVPRNSLDISSAELSEVIAPVKEYGISETKEEKSGYGTYWITVVFKKKKETVTASMSITNEGNIIDGSIFISEDIIANYRKTAKAKQAAASYLRKIF